MGEFISSNEELSSVTQGVQSIADAFDADFNTVATAATALMDQLGLSSTEALDFIAKGFQDGLNNSDDFLETIGEYSIQFGEAGYEANEFYSILQTGAQAGLLGTDKIADAFKESRIRIMELSEDVIKSFDQVGASLAENLAEGMNIQPEDLSWEDIKKYAEQEGIALTEEMAASYAEGAATAGQIISQSMALTVREYGDVNTAQEMVLEGLGSMSNVVDQNAAGVAIFGTMWEDMGSEAMLSLDLAATSMKDMSGATATTMKQYETFDQLFEGFRRSAMLALIPLGDELLKIASQTMPYIQSAFETFGAYAPMIVSSIVSGFQQLSGALSPIISIVLQISQVLFDLFSNVDTAGAVEGFSQVQSVIATMAAVVLPHLQAIAARLLEFGTAIAPHILPAFQNIANIIISIISTIVAFITENWDTIYAITSTYFNLISTIIGTAFDLIQGIIVAALQLISGDWQGALMTLGQTALQFVENLKAVFGAAFEFLKTLILAALIAIGLIFVTKFVEINTFVSSGIESVKNFFSDGLNSLVGIVGSAFGNVLSAVTSFISSFVSSGRDLGKSILDGIILGLKDTFDSVMNTIGNMARAIVDAAAEAFRVGSPSDLVYDEVGVYLMPGLDTAIEDTLPTTLKNVAGAARRVVGTLAENTNLPTLSGLGADQQHHPPRVIMDEEV
ncbi:hypothetical protein HC928_13015 [bacterium]|nr:hypothetical protein [bacterium]